MRPVLFGLVLTLLMGAKGCHLIRSSSGPNTPPSDPRVWAGTPKAHDLVQLVNANARLVSSLECSRLSIDAKVDNQSIGAEGSLACQKPASPGAGPNFRMDAVVLGKREVDIGSNGQEFWYWIRQTPQPYVYHCSYADFRAGKAHMPFPFQPEWIVEALGIGEYDPAKTYEVRASGNVIELIERTVNPQGQPVFKVTVFQRGREGVPRVAARVLRDAKGNTICMARNEEMTRDGLTGADIPYIVRLSWPQEKMELKLTLNKPQVNVAFDAARAAAVFTRQSLNGLPGYDLARGPDAPRNGDIRQAGGAGR